MKFVAALMAIVPLASCQTSYNQKAAFSQLSTKSDPQTITSNGLFIGQLRNDELSSTTYVTVLNSINAKSELTAVEINETAKSDTYDLDELDPEHTHALDLIARAESGFSERPSLDECAAFPQST
jgi:hypothetical protein